MGNVVVSQFVTVDGVVEDPGGAESFERGGWAFQFERGHEGDKFNTMPKFVVSTTLENPEWNNTTVISGDVAGEVSRLRDQFAGDVLVNGSAQLVNALAQDDLVDEWRLMVFPVVLGKGKRLFADGLDRKPLEVVETKPAGEVVILTLRPKAE